MSALERANWPQKISLATLAVYWIALFVATHVPRLEPPLSLPHGDKWLHATAFAGLTLLLALAWSLRRPFAWRSWLAVLALLAVYAALDEITQSLVGRNTDAADWLADVVGIVVGLTIFLAGRALLQRVASLTRWASADDNRPD
jgi:VanZ family protein